MDKRKKVCCRTQDTEPATRVGEELGNKGQLGEKWFFIYLKIVHLWVVLSFCGTRQRPGLAELRWGQYSLARRGWPKDTVTQAFPILLLNQGRTLDSASMVHFPQKQDTVLEKDKLIHYPLHTDENPDSSYSLHIKINVLLTEQHPSFRLVDAYNYSHLKLSHGESKLSLTLYYLLT